MKATVDLRISPESYQDAIKNRCCTDNALKIYCSESIRSRQMRAIPEIRSGQFPWLSKQAIKRSKIFIEIWTHEGVD